MFPRGGVNRGNSHATPHKPKPELSSTEPLSMSATASSALFQSFESPELATDAVADLQLLECEKLRLPLMFNLVIEGARRALGAQLTAAHCREHACLATAGAACRTARATPTILSKHNAALNVSPGDFRRRDFFLFFFSYKCTSTRSTDARDIIRRAVLVVPPRQIGAKNTSRRGPRHRHPDFDPGSISSNPGTGPVSALGNLGSQ